MNEDKILVPLDDYEEKAKDQRTVEIIRDMVIRSGYVSVDTLCTMLGITGEPWKENMEHAKKELIWSAHNVDE